MGVFFDFSTCPPDDHAELTFMANPTGAGKRRRGSGNGDEDNNATTSEKLLERQMAMLANTGVVAGFAFVHLGLCLFYYLFRVARGETPNVMDVLAIVRFPSFSFFPLLFMLQNIIEPAAHLLYYNAPVGAQVLAVILMLGSLGFPDGIRRVTGGEGMLKKGCRVVADEDAVKYGKCKRFLFGTEMWASRRDPSFERRYALLFKDFNWRCRRFLLADVAVIYAISFVSGFIATNITECTLSVLAVSLIELMYLCAVFYYKPFLTGLDFSYTVVLTSLQVLAIVLAVIGLHLAEPGWLSASAIVLLLCTLILLVKSVFDLVVFFIDRWNVRKAEKAARNDRREQRAHALQSRLMDMTKDGDSDSEGREMISLNQTRTSLIVTHTSLPVNGADSLQRKPSEVGGARGPPAGCDASVTKWWFFLKRAKMLHHFELLNSYSFEELPTYSEEVFELYGVASEADQAALAAAAADPKAISVAITAQAGWSFSSSPNPSTSGPSTSGMPSSLRPSPDVPLSEMQGMEIRRVRSGFVQPSLALPANVTDLSSKSGGRKRAKTRSRVVRSPMESASDDGGPGFRSPGLPLTPSPTANSLDPTKARSVRSGRGKSRGTVSRPLRKRKSTITGGMSPGPSSVGSPLLDIGTGRRVSVSSALVTPTLESPRVSFPCQPSVSGRGLRSKRSRKIRPPSPGPSPTLSEELDIGGMPLLPQGLHLPQSESSKSRSVKRSGLAGLIFPK
eukprot:Hpha_TRINITY_DN7664_c0_g1::TRINITY_DN7664_c0_g1_i1::g.19213::m.19213